MSAWPWHQAIQTAHWWAATVFTICQTLRTEKPQTCLRAMGKVSRGNGLKKIEPSTLRDAPDRPRRCKYNCQPVFTKWRRGWVLFAILDSSVSKGLSEPDIKVHREGGRFFACPLNVPWQGFCWDHSRNHAHCQLSGWLVLVGWLGFCAVRLQWAETPI